MIDLDIIMSIALGLGTGYVEGSRQMFDTDLILWVLGGMFFGALLARAL